MQNNKFGHSCNLRAELPGKIRAAGRVVTSGRIALLGTCLLAGAGWSAETSYLGGAALKYKYDDNINVSPDTKIGLAGAILDGFLRGQYNTQRLHASADLKLSFERYNHAKLDSSNDSLLEPDPEDFDSDNQDLKGDIAYDWERQTLSLYGRYWRDSVLNTQFLDTGLSQFSAIEGASRRTEATLRPGWKWQMTERQSLDVSVLGQAVDFEADRYIDYDFASLNVGWIYTLNERMSLQLQPYFSWYNNDAEISVESKTFGLQGGFVWALAEKWKFNLLAGGTRVYTEYGQGGFVSIDPGTGETRFIDDQDSTSFIGDSTLSYTEEHQGFSVNFFARTSPSGNGVLQQNNQGRVTYFWLPVERMRFDIDALLGSTSSTDDRIDNSRDYREAGVRFAYQIVSEWWISAHYRFREQQYDNRNSGDAGRGNSMFVTLSYRLPKEIL
jgi:hypothetical protein